MTVSSTLQNITHAPLLLPGDFLVFPPLLCSSLSKDSTNRCPRAVTFENQVQMFLREKKLMKMKS